MTESKEQKEEVGEMDDPSANFAAYQAAHADIVGKRSAFEQEYQAQRQRYKPKSYAVKAFAAPSVSAYVRDKKKGRDKQVYFFKQGRSWGVLVAG